MHYAVTVVFYVQDSTIKYDNKNRRVARTAAEWVTMGLGCAEGEGQAVWDKYEIVGTETVKDDA